MKGEANHQVDGVCMVLFFLFFRVQVEFRGPTKSVDPELLSVFLENSPTWMGKFHAFEVHIFM